MLDGVTSAGSHLPNRGSQHATGGEKATSPITAAGQAVQAAGLRHGQGKRVASEATAPLQLHTAHPKSTQEYPRGHVCHVSSDDTETRTQKTQDNKTSACQVHPRAVEERLQILVPEWASHRCACDCEFMRWSPVLDRKYNSPK